MPRVGARDQNAPNGFQNRSVREAEINSPCRNSSKELLLERRKLRERGREREREDLASAGGGVECRAFFESTFH